MIFSSHILSEIPILVLRDDLKHPIVSGNKLHKLTPNIAHAKNHNCSTVLSFGGPYSNHLHALAWACKNAGLKSIGVVRGELHDLLTPTLIDCQQWGMKLLASTRKDYRDYQTLLSSLESPCLANQASVQRLSTQLSLSEPDTTLLLPEGGSNKMAIESLSNAYSHAFNQPQCVGITHVVCTTGTGATLAGVLSAAPAHTNVIGIQAVAEGDATLNRIRQWTGRQAKNARIVPGHLGGFGKIPAELLRFISDFETKHQLPLDPIYNGKAMLKLSQMIDDGAFAHSDKILFIHTGGLQGKRQ